jgi:hypothetical protein
MLAPVADLGLERRIDSAAVGFALGNRFGEVNLLVGEQMPEQMDIGQ